MKFRIGETVTVILEGSEQTVEGLVINKTDSFEYIVNIPHQMLEGRPIQGSILVVAEKWLKLRDQQTSTQRQT